nr:potassium channel family protein [Nocardioides daedukensis]
MLLLAVAFLAAYAWPILDTDLPSWVGQACRTTVWVTWLLFALDYLVRLWLVDNKLRFVRSNLIALAVIALPLLRPLRLLRLVTLINVLNRQASTTLRGKVAVYVFGGSSLLAFLGALAVLDAERHAPDSPIQSFGDAIWWAITTMTTVGYGDTFPITTTGRFVAAGLMISGIALLGMVTATLASWLVDRVADEAGEAGELRGEIRALNEQVARLTEALARGDEAERSGTSDADGPQQAK